MAERQVLDLTCPCGASLHSDMPDWANHHRVYEAWARDHRDHAAPPPDADPLDDGVPVAVYSGLWWEQADAVATDGSGDGWESLRREIWDRTAAYAVAIARGNGGQGLADAYWSLKQVLADERLALSAVVQGNMVTLVIVAAENAKSVVR